MLSWQPSCISLELAEAVQAHAGDAPDVAGTAVRMLKACGAHEQAVRAMLKLGQVGLGCCMVLLASLQR